MSKAFEHHLDDVSFQTVIDFTQTFLNLPGSAVPAQKTTGLRIKKKIVGIKKSTRIKKILLVSKNYPQKPIPSSTIERTTCSTLRTNCSHR
jgi:hypothetical protein